MQDYGQISNILESSLGSRRPPIAVCFTKEVPEGVSPYDGSSPAGCKFWEEAFDGPFVTGTADHKNCAIGVHTHSMSGPSTAYEGELGEVLQVMSGLDYVRDEDVAAIPVLAEETSHVVYAPLSQTPAAPDVVLVFSDSRQSLTITEAAQRVDADIPPAMGRPACAVVPQAVNSGRAALSLGCCGARAYLDNLSDDVALWALPGDRIADYAEQIGSFAKANELLGTFHKLRREDVESGQSPSVSDSLARLDP